MLYQTFKVGQTFLRRPGDQSESSPRGAGPQDYTPVRRCRSNPSGWTPLPWNGGTAWDFQPSLWGTTNRRPLRGCDVKECEKGESNPHRISPTRS